MNATVGKCWLKKERRQHLYSRDSKVMDSNQSSPDLLRIVRNLGRMTQEGGERADVDAVSEEISMAMFKKGKKKDSEADEA